MAAVFEPSEPVTEVHIEGLAALKIVKHCQESLPQMVTGSLLGLTVGNGILEITHAFPFPESSNINANASAAAASGISAADDNEDSAAIQGGDDTLMDGHEFQLEMMKMLREVNVDNNCVGWYQCMYLGSYSSLSLVENQLSYQTDLSPNAVVILYDPIQTTNGNLVLKCYKLSEKALEILSSQNSRKTNKNEFMDPKSIFEEIPIKFKNPLLVQALLRDIQDGKHGEYTTTATDSGEEKGENNMDCTFERLDLSTNPYLEKHLEYLCSWVDDLSTEQHKFQYYTRNLSRTISRNEKKSKKDEAAASGKTATEPATSMEDAKTFEEGWNCVEAPRRLESLLVTNQIRSYCDQVDKFAGGGFGKLFLTGGLHKENDK